jgi:prolipoprotein diacylglyceryltransferase
MTDRRSEFALATIPEMRLASIPSPPDNGLQIGPLLLHAYGLMYAFGVIAAVALTVGLWERRGGKRELVYDVALWGFPAGLLGGRLYFLVTSWGELPDHWWGPLAIAADGPLHREAGVSARALGARAPAAVSDY